MGNLNWDDDIWDSELPCPRCGHYTTSIRNCEYCDEGIIDDLYSEDPLWYDPGDWEYCEHCHGKGYYQWCRKCGWDVIEQRFINQSCRPVREFAIARPFSFMMLVSRPLVFPPTPADAVS